jgi:hypothetical protein
MNHDRYDDGYIRGAGKWPILLIGVALAVSLIYRYYDDSFAQTGAKIGTALVRPRPAERDAPRHSPPGVRSA